MTAAPYNTWYDATYDAILTMADWSKLASDVPKKVTCIYAWMPQTIMNTKHQGGRPKWVTYSLSDAEQVLKQAEVSFADLAATQQDLTQFDISRVEPGLLRIFQLLFPLFGSVASSKYLHFSAPKLFPMWDRAIRIARGHRDTSQGFLDYMHQFKKELESQENLVEAQKAYPLNPVRGWDIVNMRNRRT